jgi:periplasmic divalent cation tolerance protein
MTTIAILTTTDSEASATDIARTLVERKLAACVQISKIESVYAWDGATQHDPEYRLLIKTTGDRYADVEAAILEKHSYDLPAICAFEMAQVFEPYARWVAGNATGHARD